MLTFNRANWGHTLNQLPRDTRDTLFLLGVISGVVALLSGHLPWWCTGFTLAVLLWRASLAWHNQALPSRWWRMGLLALTLGATLLTYRTILGRDAGVTLIVLLLALKTLELRARRDAFVVFFLSLFTLLTHFFYSQSMLTAGGILLALLGLLTALVNAHMPSGKPPLWQAAKVATQLTVVGLPIMVVLFLFFPRVAPLWGIPADALAGRSGLSSSMRVGSIASLARDSSVALRVRFDGAPLAPEHMYFRGPVLTQFDGVEWTPQDRRLVGAHRLEANLKTIGPGLAYEVTLEPSNRPWVMVLEATPQGPVLPANDVFMTPDLQWLSSKPMTDLVRYKAVSYAQFSHGPTDAALGLQTHLELPPSFNPRTLAMAQRWRRDSGYDPDAAPQLVQRALAQLRTGGYTYTLEPGLYGTHTADEFWFDRKQGFCEHIAASFVVLMRALDIPARVVTGYAGGELNAVDGFWTVRQSDAHAWAEVWLAGQGWVRVDPTAAVAPSRMTDLTRLTPAPGVVGLAVMQLSPALGQRLRATWEAVNNRWNQWVLNYSQSRQLSLLQNLGLDSPTWTDLAYILAGLLAVGGTLGAAWTLWDRRTRDPWLALLAQARQRAQKRGLTVGPQTTARQLAQALQSHWADHPDTPALVQWLLAWERGRYAAPPANSLIDLQRQFRQLTWPPAPP